MAKIKITQIKSKNGATKRQIANLQSLGIHRMHQTVEVQSLGIHRMHQTVEVELNPVTKGMLEKVLHLVTVEETK